jgi:hypothetical protein
MKIPGVVDVDGINGCPLLTTMFRLFRAIRDDAGRGFPMVPMLSVCSVHVSDDMPSGS